MARYLNILLLSSSCFCYFEKPLGTFAPSIASIDFWSCFLIKININFISPTNNALMPYTHLQTADMVWPYLQVWLGRWFCAFKPFQNLLAKQRHVWPWEEYLCFGGHVCISKFLVNFEFQSWNVVINYCRSTAAPSCCSDWTLTLHW